MIEIGSTRIIPVRRRQGRHLVPVLGPDGQPETRPVASEVLRVTRDTLGGHFGRDRNRKLVVGLRNGDLLSLRPQGTRQEVQVPLADVYAWALRSRALNAQLKKARERKAQLDQKRAERRQAAYTRKLRREAV